MSDSPLNRLAWCLFACRLSVFIVFSVWIYNSFARPEHTAELLSTYYLLPTLPDAIIYTFAGVQSLLLILLILGFARPLARGFFLVISVLSALMPMVIKGYVDALVHHPHPTILFYTGFCVAACNFAIYYLREYDTKITFCAVMLAEKMKSDKTS